ncbi:MAG TPA: DUF2007 domain-containing protein [Gemmatimonadota bacterium]|nr:DUF2007 domain-containing protein [Gemmatimonadota bacterium]
MPKTVAEFAHRHEAEYAQGFLEDAGIPSSVFDDDAGGGLLGLEIFRGARLVVPDELAESAQGVLREAGLLE